MSLERDLGENMKRRERWAQMGRRGNIQDSSGFGKAWVIALNTVLDPRQLMEISRTSTGTVPEIDLLFFRERFGDDGGMEGA